MAEKKNNGTIKWLKNINSGDVKTVGGKNASLGEMISSMKKEKIRVPGGFATTAEAYFRFVAENGIEGKIRSAIKEMTSGKRSLESAGKSIRRLFLNGDFPEEMEEDIRKAYRRLGGRGKKGEESVAVRSSATAEDLPEASFAGQQETFLNISGADDVVDACRRCYASLFTDRAISYREEKGFDHLKVALSIGVQKMVRSDKGGSGVMFSIDTETGFGDTVIINAAWGLGENVVQGAVNPDEYRVFKPLLKERNIVPIVEKTKGEKEKKMVYARGGSRTTKNIDTSKKERRSFVLSDDEIMLLSGWACRIEEHYGKPMDMEWAKDGRSGKIYIVQARPETVQSAREAASLKAYSLKEKGEKLLEGISIGEAIANGKAQVIEDAGDIGSFKEGSILVTGMTDPDWVPIMKQAAGIVTDQGGRTSHAAIVSRELGIPAVVGTGEATETLKSGKKITISCAEGEKGKVYKGLLEYEEKDIDVSDVPETRTGIMMNIASPSAAFRWWRLPCRGIGLARMEFIINNIIKIHPLALVEPEKVDDAAEKKEIERLTKGYKDKKEYFVEHLARGLGKIAASRYPGDVIVRMSDFKTNEYASLIGGSSFELAEDNPMLGFRGASRYYSKRYMKGFALECRAVKRAREKLGFRNIVVMIPFCRTVKEADKVLEALKKNGLEKGKKGLRVYVMCEIPSNVVLAGKFAERFDGFSIGSNDLTQLVLGTDRDNENLSDIFDETDEAVKKMIADLLKAARKKKTKVGICGQAPSDYPRFAQFLVEEGIDTLSLNPDSVIEVTKAVAGIEKKLKRKRKKKKR
ncbi:MAG: phosphoenolpyruvate synthase [Candidatus Omnitrophica bacterium]|nr:phosphoenolpyruvate synthase [Candidatus Omnitrophota bacterium]